MCEGVGTAGLELAAAGLGVGACCFAVVEVEVFEQLEGNSPERLMAAMTAMCDTPMPDRQHLPSRFPARQSQPGRRPNSTSPVIKVPQCLKIAMVVRNLLLTVKDQRIPAGGRHSQPVVLDLDFQGVGFATVGEGQFVIAIGTFPLARQRRGIRVR